MPVRGRRLTCSLIGIRRGYSVGSGDEDGRNRDAPPVPEGAAEGRESNPARPFPIEAVVPSGIRRCTSCHDDKGFLETWPIALPSELRDRCDPGGLRTPRPMDDVVSKAFVMQSHISFVQFVHLAMATRDSKKHLPLPNRRPETEVSVQDSNLPRPMEFLWHSPCISIAMTTRFGETTRSIR
jgi:hypothetical protein